MDEEAFRLDQKRFDAVVHNLEIIVDACKQVPETMRALANQIEWKRMPCPSYVFIHAYFGVDTTIIRNVLEAKVPALLTSARELLASSRP